MEFVIRLEDGGVTSTPSSGNQSSGSPPAAAAPASVAQPSSVPVANLQSIQQTLLPAIAATAPTLARDLYAHAADSAAILPPVEQMTPILEGPQLSLGESLREAMVDEATAIRELYDFLKGDVLPELHELTLASETLAEAQSRTEGATAAAEAGAGPSLVPARSVLSPEEVAQLVREFGKEGADKILASATVAQEIGQAAGAAVGQEILPALEELRLEREEERGILPPLDELRVAGELPGAAAERAARAAREKAARENVEQGPAQIEEPADVIDPAVEEARRQIEAEKYRARVRAARANIEQEPADAIDPAEEARQKHLKEVQKQLNSGSRIAAQAGLGTTGQLLGGAADLAVGAGTGNYVQAVEGGLEVLQAGVHLTAEAFDTARAKIELMSAQVQAVVRNDYWGVVDNQLNDVSHALEKIPFYGEMVSAAFDAVVAPVRAFHDVVAAFVERGRQLQGFSPELAGANAMADVRTLLEDLHEADVLGPELARLTDAQSQLSIELRELFLPVKEWIVEKLATVMEEIADYVRAGRVGIDLFKEFASDVLTLLEDIATLSPKKAKEHLDAAIGRIADILTRPKEHPESALLDRLYSLHAQAGARPGPDAARDEAARQPPLFNPLPGF